MKHERFDEPLPRMSDKEYISELELEVSILCRFLESREPSATVLNVINRTRALMEKRQNVSACA